MSRAVRFLLIAGILVFGIGTMLIFSGRSRNRSALAKYKAELRAKGEKLSTAELGYPRAPEPKASFDRLEAAVRQIGTLEYHPGTLQFMRFVDGGRAEVGWAVAEPKFVWSRNGKTISNSATWADFSAQFEPIADLIEEIRDATQSPPRWCVHDPTNLVNRPMVNFVAMRGAAQMLAGDAIAALHAHELDRAQTDLRAITRLA